jgi:glycosyltransferase involved in cell wall biosynthesis
VKATIAIVTGVPLAQNPRAVREAATLATAGYKVIVLGAEFRRPGAERDHALAGRHGFEFHPVGSLDGAGTLANTRAYWWRMRHRLGREVFKLCRLENPYQVGYFVPELTRAAVKLAADYYVLHVEQALWVGAVLLRHGRSFGVDMEDWYSEDLSPAVRAQRPLRRMRALEKQLLRGASHVSCPSHAMSVALVAEFGCPSPTVIYNAVSWGDRELIDDASVDRKEPRIPSIHWFSQTIGEGRGLEDLLAALPLVRAEAELHIRGNPANGFEEWLLGRLPQSWKARTFVHSPVPAAELLSRVAEHDIGFAGEQKYCRNKELTVSNKILAYMTGGLAVVASDTDGHREVAAAAGEAVCLYRAGDPRSLADELNRLLLQPGEMAARQKAALKAAESTFSWEKMSPVLLEAVRAGVRHQQGRVA